MSHNDFEDSASYVRTVRLLNLLRMKKMTYDFLQMGINPETAGILIVHIVQVLYQTVSVSQDKVHEIKKIFDVMGLPYILSHIDVENILRLKPGAAERVQAGGSPRMTPAQFMSSMGIKPNSKKSSPFSSYSSSFAKRKSSTKTTQKRGGGHGDCYGRCKKDTDCHDANCMSCVNRKCVPSEEGVPDNTGPSNVVGVVVQRTTNPAVLGLAIRSELAQQALVLEKMKQEANNEERKTILTTLTNREDAALESINAQRKEASENLRKLEKELSEMVDAASKAHDAEFDKLLGTLENDLKGRQRNEKVAGVVGAVAGLLGINFFTNQLDNIAGGLYTFITWILLAGQSVLDYIPFLSRVIPRFLDATCFKSPLPNMWNGAIFPILKQTNITSTTYDFTWKTMGWDAYKVFGSSDCPNNTWLGQRIGECTVKKGFETITDCSAAGIQFFRTNADLFYLIMLLGSVIGGLFFYLTYRITTLQTPATDYELLTTKKKRRGTDWFAPIRVPLDVLKDSAKGMAVASIAGAYLMAPFPSAERAQLESNVANKEVPYENFDYPIGRGEFRTKRDELYKTNIEYTTQIRAINDARDRQKRLEDMGLKLLQETTQNQKDIAKLLIKHQKETSDDIMRKVIPTILNDPAATPQLLLENLGSNRQLPKPVVEAIEHNSSPLSTTSSSSSSSASSSPSSSASSSASASPSSSPQSSPLPRPRSSRKSSRKEGGRRKRGTRRSIRRRTSRRRK